MGSVLAHSHGDTPEDLATDLIHLGLLEPAPAVDLRPRGHMSLTSGGARDSQPGETGDAARCSAGRRGWVRLSG